MPPDPAAIDLAAIVAADERDTIVAAAHRLSHILGDEASGWPLRVHFVAADAAPPAPAALLIASLRADADAFAASPEAIAARWRGRITAWRALGGGAILMPTLFRHAGGADHAAIAPIRRLDLVALGLSRTAGIQIVDVDRLFALVGARTLRTDYRGGGETARALAAHAFVAAILAAGLDAQVPPARQEQALERNGGREAIAAIVAQSSKEEA